MGVTNGMAWGLSGNGAIAGDLSGGKLAFSLLGGFSLAYQGRPVDLGSRKAQALLAYVALSPNLGATREQAAGLLWSDVPEAQARASLRQVLRGLRKVFETLGASALKISRSDVRLDGAQLEVDVWDVVDSVERTAPNTMALQRKFLMESLLDGYEDLDDSLRSWLLVQRQNLHDRVVLSLETQLAEIGERIPPNRIQEVKSLAIALSNLDPTHEGACRRLMQVSALEADISGALRRYSALWDLLDSEYDMEPSDETQALVAEIKSGQFKALEIPQAAPAAPVSPATVAAQPRSVSEQARRPRLVVGSFGISPANGNGAPIEEVHHDLLNGVRHQLIASLVRFREWSVVDGSSGNVAAPNAASGQVQYLVDASGVRSGERVRLVLTLYDQSNGEFVWSEEHETDLEQWFMTQRLVVRRMAIALNVQISADRMQRILWEPSDVTLSVYDRWLQAAALTNRWRKGNRLKAAEIFQEIIEDVPSFAPAHFGLANFSNSYHLIFPGAFRTAERTKEALAQAKSAVSLDPTNCRAHLCAAWSYALDGHFDQAELSYEMAFELNENDPWTLVSSTLGLSFCGRQDIARGRADQALEVGLTVQPLHWGYQAVIRFLCNDYEGCVEAAVRSEDAVYNFAAWNAAALAHLGRVSDAKAEWQRFVELVRKDWREDRPQDEGAIADWLLKAFPIRNTADWERLRDGLKIADVPVPAVSGS